MSTRSALAAPIAVLVLATAGCGGGDETSGADKARESTRTQETVPADAVTGKQTVPEQTETVPSATAEDNGGGKAPERQPGGAGDEVPNATQALITGRGGRLSPRAVSAPPFIAVSVELRSTDGRDYALSGGGKSLRAGEGESSASAVLPGLRPGKTLKLSGPQGTVVISANAEPGP
ncbi:MAG: hypothetical protein ACR2J6_06090 [Thermoleophilaceae bacterium]